MLKYNEQGRCPKCGSLNIEYGKHDFEGNIMYYPCKCLECGKKYDEVYYLKFVEVVINEDY